MHTLKWNANLVLPKDESMSEDAIRITIIATGLKENGTDNQLRAAARTQHWYAVRKKRLKLKAKAVLKAWFVPTAISVL